MMKATKSLQLLLLRCLHLSNLLCTHMALEHREACIGILGAHTHTHTCVCLLKVSVGSEGGYQKWEGQQRKQSECVA